MEVAIDGIAGFLEGISTKEVPASDIWFLSPRQHAVELIAFNIFIFGVFLSIITQKFQNADGKEQAKNKPAQQQQKRNMGDERQVLTWPLHIYRTILLGCFFLTIYHKVQGKKISNMLMPCHVTTVFYLFFLFTPNKRHAEAVFNVSVHYMFFTWLAILFPDKRGLHQFLEIPNFWVHHWILFLIPFHILFTGFYKIDHTKHTYFKWAIVAGMFIHVNMMTTAGMMSGLNVGYMLAPPPKTPLGKGMYFRWTHSLFLVVMGWVCAYPIPAAISKINSLFSSLFSKKKAQ